MHLSPGLISSYAYCTSDKADSALAYMWRMKSELLNYLQVTEKGVDV